MQPRKRARNRVDQKPFFENQIYSIKNIYDTKQQNKIIQNLYTYNLQKIAQNNLKKHLQFYHQLFNKRDLEINKSQNIHFIHKQQHNLNDNLLYIYTTSFKYKLDQHLKNNQITFKQKNLIFQQILQATYCVYKDYYSCNNIRAENFVYAPVHVKRHDPAVRPSQNNIKPPQPQYRWKLASLPYGYHCRKQVDQKINCPFIWRPEYQPPQSYLHELNDAQLSQSLVWNIGCILLQMQMGSHKLSSQDAIKQFTQHCIKKQTIDLSHYDIKKQKKQITGNLAQIIKRMLCIDPNKRMKTHDMFSIPLLTQNIKIYKQKHKKQMLQLTFFHNQNQQSSIIKNVQINNLIQISSIFQKQHKLWYQTLQQFVVNLINITEDKKLPLTHQQLISVRMIQSKNSNQLSARFHCHSQPVPMKKRMSIGPQNYNSVSINEQQLSRKDISIQQLQHYLKPYKFYLDKTIFLFRFSHRISLKLSQIMAAKIKYELDNKQINNKNICNKQVFNFRCIVIFLRLIYFQTLLQNLKLKQNVFNIPLSKPDINNMIYDNMDQKWQVFSSTSIYQALTLYVSQKKQQCVKQFTNLMDQGRAQATQQFQQLSFAIKYISSLDYHVCTFHKFMPVYQSTIKSISSIIDIRSIINKGFKNPPPYLSYIPEEQNIKNIAYLINAMFIQSKKLYNSQYYYQYFEKYMTSQNAQDQPDILQFSNRTSPLLMNSNKNGSNRIQKNGFQNVKSKQIFDFMNYQRFLKKGDNDRIKDHVNYLLSKFNF